MASLDYPVAMGMNADVVRKRMRWTHANARTLLETIQMGDYSPFPYLCVHGLDRRTARKNAEKLLDLAKKRALFGDHFGIAIGSLVPLRFINSPLVIFEIVAGVMEALAGRGMTEKTPIHVFGVSGSMIPFLHAMGVRSFDSSSYARSASNLRYYTAFPFKQIDFLSLSTISCACPYCKEIAKSGLRRAQEILGRPAYQVHQFNGFVVNKSYIYGLLAMHNWRKVADGFSTLCEMDATEFEREILEISMESPAGRKLLSAFAMVDSSWKEKLPPGLPLLEGLRKSYPNVRPDLTPNDFDLSRRKFKPQSSRLLLLACSSTRPYSESPSHRFVERRLAEAGLSSKTYDKVTVSGLYGPVPIKFESEPEVLEYDLKLSRHHDDQIGVVAGRVADFLRRHAGKYDVRVAYVTSSGYRRAIELASKQSGVHVDLLPQKPARRGYYSRRAIGVLAKALE